MNKLCGMLGLARRAGNIACGFDAVKAAVFGGKARLLLYADDISEKTLQRVMFLAAEAGMKPILSGISMEEIGAAVGKAPCGIIAILDTHMAKGIVSLLEKGSG